MAKLTWRLKLVAGRRPPKKCSTKVVESNAVVPSIRRLEVGTAFQMAIRCKRINEIFRDDAPARLLALPITAARDARSQSAEGSAGAGRKPARHCLSGSCDEGRPARR